MPHYNHRDQSNRLVIIYKRINIAYHIEIAFLMSENAKEFLKSVEQSSESTDKSLAGVVMSTFTTMKFDGSRTMHEHVIDMKT